MKQSAAKSSRPRFIRRAKICVLAIMCLLLFFDALGIIANIYLEQYQNKIDNFTDSTIGDIDILFSSMIDQETGLRGYIITAQPLFLEPLYHGRNKYVTTLPHLVFLLQNTHFRNTQKTLTRFVTISEQWYYSFALHQIHLMNNKAYAEPRSVENEKRGKNLFDSFRQTTQRLKKLVIQDNNTFQRNTTLLMNTALISTGIITALFLILLQIVTGQGFVDLRKQLYVLLKTMEAYGKGNYAIRIQPMKYEEFQLVAEHFNEMVDLIEQQQQELRQSEQHFRLLADTLPQIVWTSMPDGGVDYYNQQWFDYTGMTLEQTLGWGWEPILHPDDLQKGLEVWKQSLIVGESYQLECRMKRASDGIYRWHLTRAHPFRDANGKIIKWFGTSTDIEDLKRAEQALIQANQDQHNFVSTVSHEFRTTLTSIQGFSELLRVENFQETEVKEYANDIYSDATRLNRMITDLLDLGKMQSGRAILQVEELDFNKLIFEVVERVKTIAPDHSIDLKLEQNLPKMRGDQDKLIQVLYNLLSNSVKYSPQGGKIFVETTREGAHIHTCIQDQGVGIPAEALEKIFQAYNRVHAEDTRYIKGTGLGLPIVRHIVEMHQGKIWVESRPGQGSTFHFTLPLKLLVPTPP